jgi:hypothetical protein
MRMWLIDPKKMCRQHLLGEHVEMHMFVGAINKNISIDGYIDGGLVEPRKIKARHSELVAEMKRRGMNHKSPLPKFSVRGLPKGNVDIKANMKELKRRCKECRSIR